MASLCGIACHVYGAGSKKILPSSSPTLSHHHNYHYHASFSCNLAKGGASAVPKFRLNHPFPSPPVLRVGRTGHFVSCSINEKSRLVPSRSVSVILLAGGKGKRMGADMPKQYLPLLGQPVALHSFHTFGTIEEVKEIVIVCDPSYRHVFEEFAKDKLTIDLKFALPGKERQDSVLSGLKEISCDAKLACVHDSARPLVTIKDIHKVFADAWNHGAAVLGVPVKATIKEAGNDCFVIQTLDRRRLWEIQTPQVIEPNLLLKGFDLVQKENLEVTDDVSIVEHLNHPVFVTEGSYTNLKITTPDDMLVAERILSNQS